MLGLKDSFDRHVAQICRLISQDFPWLWAINKCWYLPAHNIKVIHEKLHGPSRLWSELISEPRVLKEQGLLQVFVYLSNGKYWREVKEVNLNDGFCLAESIMYNSDSVSCGYGVVNVVEVFKSPVIDGEHDYHIFCSPKGHDFNGLIEQAFASA